MSFKQCHSISLFAELAAEQGVALGRWRARACPTALGGRGTAGPPRLHTPPDHRLSARPTRVLGGNLTAVLYQSDNSCTKRTDYFQGLAMLAH